jgi:DNA polymerase-4
VSRSQLDRPGRPEGLGDDDTGATVLHVDMDAFYASCELRARPELRGRPVIVGVTGSRSVVLAATYEARGFGVHSAMPMSAALRCCPSAVVLPPTSELYAEVSAAVMAVFADVTPLVEPLSLDEAFLDVAGAVRRLGSPRVIGEQIRTRVRTEQGITCSVGVASSKHVAKLASTRCKPDGLLVVPRDQVLEFLHPLPVSALWGVGAKTAQALRRLGITTVGELAHAPEAALRHSLGSAVGSHLYDLAWGRDARRVEPYEAEKSIGAEETFATDVADPEVLRAELLRLSARVAARLRAHRLVGRTVVIKVRFADFRTITRSRTLREPTDVAREVYATAVSLHEALGLDRVRVRLVGVRVEGLEPAAEAARQLAFGGVPGEGVVDAAAPPWRDAEEVVDLAASRYGRGALVPARLVARADDPPATPRGPAVPHREPRASRAIRPSPTDDAADVGGAGPRRPAGTAAAGTVEGVAGGPGE